MPKKLNNYKPRPYQVPILKALDSGFKRVVAILPRRAGKDMTALNYMIRQMWKKPGVYFYIFPTYQQSRKVIWDSINAEGNRVLDYFPRDLIIKRNIQEMKIRMMSSRPGSESLFQLLGSDNVDSLVGTNPCGCVFSEYALQDPRAYQYLRPILVENGGWALFISTPRGKNHLYNMYQAARNNSDWFAYKLSLDDTKHIPKEEIEKERADGIISEDLIQQEYYCSFEMGIEGAYYTKYLDSARKEGRIGSVPWESAHPVHTAWDLGVRDKTSIIFFQTIGNTVRIIDCYENSKKGLEHYAQLVENRPYLYSKHIAPHDIKVKEFGTGVTRLEKARSLGVHFSLAPNQEIADGIEACRSLFSRLYVDEVKCKPFLKAVENYRQQFDHKNQCYKQKPLHDWSSHFCFHPDTKIITANGKKPIYKITPNDLVLTLNGFQPCSGAYMVYPETKAIAVKFQSGYVVICTPDHQFLTSSGYVEAEDLSYADKIHSGVLSWPTDFNAADGYHLIQNILPHKKIEAWCLTVPEYEHFTLENGAIVHNCDAFRYLALGLNKTAKGTTSEDLERIYRKAMGGDNQGGFFGFI